MSVEGKIAEVIRKRGFKIKAISNETGIPYSALQPALKGRRPLRADEFFALCDFLQLDPAEFKPDVTKSE